MWVADSSCCGIYGFWVLGLWDLSFWVADCVVGVVSVLDWEMLDLHIPLHIVGARHRPRLGGQWRNHVRVGERRRG